MTGIGQAARREFQRAIELNPSYASAHQFVWLALLMRMGRFKEAIAEDKRAVELDPLSLIINRDLGVAFYEARQYDQAIEQSRKTLEMDPNFLAAHRSLGWAYVQKSMYKEGIAEFEKVLGDLPWQSAGAVVPRIRLCGGGAEGQRRRRCSIN